MYPFLRVGGRGRETAEKETEEIRRGKVGSTKQIYGTRRSLQPHEYSVFVRKLLMEQAAAVYHADTATQAHVRLAQWAQQWREQAPQSVATLERDFAQTLVFYEITGLDLTWIRTTSLLERTNRELRRKFRQAVTFGSLQGVEATIYLQIRRLHAQWRRETWWDTSQEVFFDLKNLHP